MRKNSDSGMQVVVLKRKSSSVTQSRLISNRPNRFYQNVTKESKLSVFLKIKDRRLLQAPYTPRRS